MSYNPHATFIHSHSSAPGLAAAGQPADSERTQRMTEVLIVEDEAAVRQALRLVLEEAGYPTQEVEDGLDGLQILWTCPDAKIVLLDHFLPHMNAEQLLVLVSDAGDRLRRHQYIEVTGGGDRLSPACRKLLSSLEIPLVAKPFDIETLLAAVAQAEGR